MPTNCQRCGKPTIATIMSMFSHAMICGDCKDAETKRPDYKAAEGKDLREYAGRVRSQGMNASANRIEKAASDIEKGQQSGSDAPAASQG